MQITEFVPEVFMLERHRVCLLDRVTSRNCLEQGQMRGARLVKTGQQSVDDPDAALRRNDQIGPASGTDEFAVPINTTFQRADNGGSDGDHATPAAFRFADPLGGPEWHFVPLFVRRLMR